MWGGDARGLGGGLCVTWGHVKRSTGFKALVFLWPNVRITVIIVFRNQLIVLLLSSFCVSYQETPPGRLELSQNILQQQQQQQHSSGVHTDTGSPPSQQNTNTQNSRLQSNSSFGLGDNGAPGGEGADPALDVSDNVLTLISWDWTSYVICRSNYYELLRTCCLSKSIWDISLTELHLSYLSTTAKQDCWQHLKKSF